MLALVSTIAHAQPLPTLQDAARTCAEEAGGWLTCEPEDDGVLDCACATSAAPARDAFFVKCDAETTTSHFDGRLLVARDLTSEQSVSVWFDALATAEDIAVVYGVLMDEFRAAVDAGLSEDLAAQTAAERASGDTGRHEVGHWIGLVR